MSTPERTLPLTAMLHSQVNTLRHMLLLMGALGCLCVFGSCSLFDGEDESAEGVCEDVFHNYADEFYPGVTSAQCAEAPRGEWIDGRCYCHGAE